MVLQFQLRHWGWVETLIRRIRLTRKKVVGASVGSEFSAQAATSLLLLGVSLWTPSWARAEDMNLSESGAESGVRGIARVDDGMEFLRNAEQYYKAHDYFKSARYAFTAMEVDTSLKPKAYAWVTLGLMNAGLPHSAIYFFIRTLQTKNKAAIRSVLSQTQSLFLNVGVDLIRKYLIRHTNYDDYDAVNRSAYLYALAKEAILTGDYNRAVGFLSAIPSTSPVWPFALHLRGTAYALQNKNDEAISDFKGCASRSSDIVKSVENDPARTKRMEREADDLKSRCLAGQARTLYQMDDFVATDRAYDRLPKRSLVWPDILFEQAWNSFGRMQYNRTLGKLVSYKSPALNFIFNSEIDVLRAQSYLSLCLYGDTVGVVEEFNNKYTQVGIDVKKFIENNSENLPAFYDFGKQALGSSLYTDNLMHKMANRFIRGPYFQNLVQGEKQIAKERESIAKLDAQQAGVKHNLSTGFPGFLNLALNWRVRTIQLIGGAFVKNSLMDYYSELLADFEKISFIKLEILKKEKDKLLYRGNPPDDGRDRGNVHPEQRDDQYYWTFNGEFWTDELGDYVFGLESQCQQAVASNQGREE